MPFGLAGVEHAPVEGSHAPVEGSHAPASWHSSRGVHVTLVTGLGCGAGVGIVAHRAVGQGVARAVDGSAAAMLHARQSSMAPSPQALSHTPSTQKPLEHSLSAVHGSPIVFSIAKFAARAHGRLPQRAERGQAGTWGVDSHRWLA